MSLRRIIYLLIAVFILAAALFNPDLEQHKAALKPEIQKGLSDALVKNGLPRDNALYRLVTNDLYESYLWKDLVENEVTRDNWIIFSISKCNYRDKEYPVAIGILGKVFVFPQVKVFVADLFTQLIKQGGGLKAAK